MKKYILITFVTSSVYCESVREIIERCLAENLAAQQIFQSAGPADDQPAICKRPGSLPIVPVDIDTLRPQQEPVLSSNISKLTEIQSMLQRLSRLPELSLEDINTKTNLISLFILESLPFVLTIKDMNQLLFFLTTLNDTIALKMQRINKMINDAITIKKDDKLLSFKIWNKFTPLKITLNGQGKFAKDETIDQLQESSRNLSIKPEDQINGEDFIIALNNIKLAIKLNNLDLVLLNFYAYYRFLELELYNLNYNIQKSYANDTKAELQSYLDQISLIIRNLIRIKV